MVGWLNLFHRGDLYLERQDVGLFRSERRSQRGKSEEGTR